jgi:hypothetical protein
MGKKSMELLESERIIWIKRILRGLEIGKKVKSESYRRRRFMKSDKKESDFCNRCIELGKVCKVRESKNVS